MSPTFSSIEKDTLDKVWLSMWDRDSTIVVKTWGGNVESCAAQLETPTQIFERVAEAERGH